MCRRDCTTPPLVPVSWTTVAPGLAVLLMSTILVLSVMYGTRCPSLPLHGCSQLVANDILLLRCVCLPGRPSTHLLTCAFDTDADDRPTLGGAPVAVSRGWFPPMVPVSQITVSPGSACLFISTATSITCISVIVCGAFLQSFLQSVCYLTGNGDVVLAVYRATCVEAVGIVSRCVAFEYCSRCYSSRSFYGTNCGLRRSIRLYFSMYSVYDSYDYTFVYRLLYNSYFI
jgi:hypothetical protein